STPLCPVVTFLLLILPLPTSPLFPYTTLFRSLCRGHLSEGNCRSSAAHNAAGGRGFIRRGKDGCQPSAGEKPRRCFSLAGGRILDRKSTRLNSSHVSISYAVFCLKKKKTNTFY